MNKKPIMSFDLMGEKHRPDLNKVLCRNVCFIKGEKMNHFTVRDLANFKRTR